MPSSVRDDCQEFGLLVFPTLGHLLEVSPVVNRIDPGVGMLVAVPGNDQDGEVVQPPRVGAGLPGVGKPLQHCGHIYVYQRDGATGIKEGGWPACAGREQPTAGCGIQQLSSPAGRPRAAPGWVVGIEISQHCSI